MEEEEKALVVIEAEVDVDALDDDELAEVMEIADALHRTEAPTAPA